MVRHLFAALLSLPLLIAGCTAPMETQGEDEGESGSAITGTVKDGEQYITTARLNLREGPSTKDDIVTTLPLNAKVTVLDGTPENGFYRVDTDEGEGYVFGTYLKSGATKVKPAPAADDDDEKGVTTGKTGTGKIETCQASFYDESAGSETASGDPMNSKLLTAAHKTLPFKTIVRVTNKANGKTVDVKINDRGPFVKGRCIDLTTAAFKRIAATSAGVANVTVEVLK